MRNVKNMAGKGFSLIELLVVILIIALIVAIVLPALGGARSLAKRADSESLAANFSTAIGSFQLSERRLPGQFSVREMAHPDNLARGMSMTENVMLELGAMRVQATAPTPTTGWVDNVGPTTDNARQVWVKPDETQGKAYYTPSAKYYIAQDDQAQAGQLGHTGPAGAPQLPDLVDGFGNPILVWMEDEATLGKAEQAIGGAGDAGKVVFARATYVPAEGPAKFYWATNAAFLRSLRLGKGGMNIQSSDVNTGNFLGADVPGNSNLNALAAILGNPAFPLYPGGNVAANADQIWPGASRGSYVVHSAGIDGTYLGKKAKFNRGSTLAQNGTLYYGATFKDPNSGLAHVDSNGKETARDFAKEFDDLILAGN
jgi:prepilin-type N-terminal cleavage/methylation domain-containing protein